MGCDIHGYWEVKTKEQGWIAVKPVNRDRNYRWFGIIGDVRCSSDGWDSSPWHRGTPTGVSSMWEEYSNDWGDDLHSCTWLTPSEVNRAGRLYLKSCSNSDWNDDFTLPEKTLTSDDMIDKLYFGISLDKDGYSTGEITINWFSTVEDFRDKSEPFERTVRMVIGFDN